jgi:hypothetical protein
LASGCLFSASYLGEMDSKQGFWVYSALMGFLNGMFSGIAYQAPMLACQLYFPDRKSLIGGLLLLSLAIGQALYSYLTSFWATDCTVEHGCANLSLILRNLSYFMFGHAMLATVLMSSPRTQLTSDDMRHL